MALIWTRHRTKHDKKLGPNDFNPTIATDANPIPVDDMRMLKPAFASMRRRAGKRRRTRNTISEAEKARRQRAFLNEHDPATSSDRNPASPPPDLSD